MSINDATRFEWDRLRTAYPPVEEIELSPPLLDKYIALANEEQREQDLLKSLLDEDEEDEDVVNSPNHYNNGSIECIEGIQASMSTEEFAGYLKGNCMKYLWRYNYKGKPVQDLQKAQWYLAELIKELVFDNEEE